MQTMNFFKRARITIQHRLQHTAMIGANDTTLFPMPLDKLSESLCNLLKAELLCDKTRMAPRAMTIHAA